MSSKKNNFSSSDHRFMKLAINLAKVNLDLTGLNPSVGCVIVKNREIISYGQTGFKGRPHAEYSAIKNCKKNLQNIMTTLLLWPSTPQHYGTFAKNYGKAAAPSNGVKIFWQLCGQLWQSCCQSQSYQEL